MLHFESRISARLTRTALQNFILLYRISPGKVKYPDASIRGIRRKEHHMKYLTDRCILLLYCLCSLLFLPLETAFVSAFFLAISVSMFLYVYPDPWVRCAVTIGFAAALFFFSPLVLFLPLVLYSFYFPWQEKPHVGLSIWRADRFSGMFAAAAAYLPGLTAIAGLLFQTDPARKPQVLFFICTGCILSVLLRQKTDSYETLSATYRKTHDDDTEIKLLLQEKNQSLLEKQNYEIYAATLGERNRIAREIHDNVGHMLTRSILMVGALKAINKDAALSESICQLDETLNLAMNSIRESVHDLHDRSVNLESSLRTLADDFTFCPVSLEYDMSANVPADIKYCFIAVVKEALVNISRHSNATRASITAQEHPAFYRLSISDNGTGAGGVSFSSSDSEFSRGNSFFRGNIGDTSVRGGIGLFNMQNRVASLKGTMQIFRDHGFCVFITIPISQYNK